jgi:fumarate reductase flavoprotein subunit
VFDSKWESQVPLSMIGHGSTIAVTDQLRQTVTKSTTADTIEELATKMGVPVETLKATIERYNQMCYQQYDEDFGKSLRRLYPVATPPFYAGKGSYAFLVVFSGLICNAKLQALDANFKAIPGLYLAGNTMGGRMSIDYPTTCPGISHGMAVTYGRLAGQNAAAG